MNDLMTFRQFLGLKFSDLVEIIYNATSGKSILYESFDESKDFYFHWCAENKSARLVGYGLKTDSTQKLDDLIQSVSPDFEGNSSQKIYCQIVEPTRHYNNRYIYMYLKTDADELMFKSLKKSLKGKGWPVRKAPVLKTLNNTVTKRFISKMVKETYSVKNLKSTILKEALKKVSATHLSENQEIMEAIYDSILKTGEIVILNEYSPDRHDMRVRRKAARICDIILKNDVLNEYKSKAMSISFTLCNILLKEAAGSSLYDNRAFTRQWNSFLRDHRNKNLESYKMLCEKYCLSSEDDNPVKSTLAGLVIYCSKTGLFIKTTSRYKLFRDLENI